MRIAVEPWSPEYGFPIEASELAPSGAEVDVSVELPAHAWRPIDVPTDTRAPACVDFIDGVRRIDARVWITGDNGSTRMGLCASYAAGRVHCNGSNARIVQAEVRRGLFAPAGTPDLITKVGVWRALAVASDDIDKLSQGIQERMADLERSLAAGAEELPDRLLVLDGPLTGKLTIPGAVGYVKTHRVAYLPPTVSATVAALGTGQRTPLFVTQSSWSRYSWYLRLPTAGAAAHPWSGIVRCEASADLALAAAHRLANITACSLPRFASQPHKDARAPQNLYPIAGLERELRRRLGDAAWIWRAVKGAAGA